MILKIDTAKQEETKVGLKDKKGKEVDKIIVRRKPGSQALLPVIIQILKKHNLQSQDLTGIEVNTGPGSYTGLRVGVSVANTLGHFLDIPVNGKKGKIVNPKYE